MFLAEAILFVGIGLISLALPRDSALVSTIVRMIAQATLPVIAIGLLAVYARRIERAPLRSLGPIVTRWSVPCLVVGMAVIMALHVSSLLVGRAIGQVPDAAAATPEVGGVLLVLAFIENLITASFLLQGFPEELLFRGAMMRTLGSRPAVAVAVSTILFAIIHIMSRGGQENMVERIIYVVQAGAFAYVGAALVLLTRSLWAAVGVHGGFHVGSLLVDLVGVADQHTPAAWICNSICFIVVGSLLLLVAKQRGAFDRPITFER